METRTVQAVLASQWDGLLPINPSAIAQRYGIEVIPLNPAEGLSGLADVRDDGTKIIGYNPNEPRYRIRFTIAHEFAHHLLGHTQGNKACFRDFTEGNHYYENPAIETAANKFAAELLMPEKAITVAIERQGVTKIAQLANVFDVSESAMYWRLRNLGYAV